MSSTSTLRSRMAGSVASLDSLRSGEPFSKSPRVNRKLMEDIPEGPSMLTTPFSFNFLPFLCYKSFLKAFKTWLNCWNHFKNEIISINCFSNSIYRSFTYWLPERCWHRRTCLDTFYGIEKEANNRFITIFYFQIIILSVSSCFNGRKIKYKFS